MLNQYFGSVNNYKKKNSIFWSINLKKGNIVQFGVNHYSDPFDKCHSAYGLQENNNFWQLQNIRINIWGLLEK